MLVPLTNSNQIRHTNKREGRVFGGQLNSIPWGRCFSTPIFVTHTYVHTFCLTHSDKILHGNPCGDGRVLRGLQCPIQSGGPNAHKYFGLLRTPTWTCRTTTVGGAPLKRYRSPSLVVGEGVTFTRSTTSPGGSGGAVPFRSLLGWRSKHGLSTPAWLSAVAQCATPGTERSVSGHIPVSWVCVLPDMRVN